MNTNELVRIACAEKREEPWKEAKSRAEYTSALSQLPLEPDAAISILQRSKDRTSFAEISIGRWLRYDPRNAEPRFVIVEERLIDMGFNPEDVRLRCTTPLEIVSEDAFEYDRRSIWVSTQGLRRHSHEQGVPCRYVPWTNGSATKEACSCNALLCEIYLGAADLENPHQSMVTKLNRMIVTGKPLKRRLRNTAVTSIVTDDKRRLAAPGFSRADQIGAAIAARFDTPAEQETVRELARQCAYTEPLDPDALWLCLSSAVSEALDTTPDSIDWVSPEQARMLYAQVSTDPEVSSKLIPRIIARCNSHAVSIFCENEEGEEEERRDLPSNTQVDLSDELFGSEEEPGKWTVLLLEIVTVFSHLRTAHPHVSEASLLHKAFVSAAAPRIGDNEAECIWSELSKSSAGKGYRKELLKRVHEELSTHTFFGNS
ncbi:hypothetical protein [Schaalia cardiffensis]|uniref:hypothetical protein n=1 Tax=Schaalia cardiffensis TaxID=181487 RepID=UPI0023F09E08|nr:hypothetical protein [Schaalia cardiffensis]